MRGRSGTSRQGGAALLLAMVIMTLVATVAASMVWQQQRAVDVESAERARVQAGWILTGALDWSRLILREDKRGVDDLGEPWATPLAEARLSTFLAADRNNNADSSLEAFLSGAIVDAQSRWNLRNLINAEGKEVETEKATLRNLCTAAAVPTDTADRLAAALSLAWAPATAAAATATTSLAPTRVSELVWLGLDAATVARLGPFIEILPPLNPAAPTPTPVNFNTASREVMVAVVAGLDAGTAERLVQHRQRQPFEKMEDIQAIAGAVTLDPARVSVFTQWFDVYGRLRLEDRILEEHSLIRRPVERSQPVTVVRRDRRAQVGARP